MLHVPITVDQIERAHLYARWRFMTGQTTAQQNVREVFADALARAADERVKQIDQELAEVGVDVPADLAESIHRLLFGGMTDAAVYQERGRKDESAARADGASAPPGMGCLL